MDEHTTAPRHTSGDDLEWRTYNGLRVADVDLEDGETAWNPASTRSVICGPARLRYVRWPDGRVTCSDRL